jgi:hypothetical protein
MSSRKVKINGVQTKFAFNKNKKYKYNKSGGLEEATTIADDDIILSGSKSSLRRMADLERNISILATKLMTTDGGAVDGDDDNYGRTESSDIRFKGDVRIDEELDMRNHVDMNNNRIHSLGTPTSGSDAANKSYVDARESAAEATASSDATSKANAAQASAISTASADATSKANAAQSAAATDATSKANAAQSAAATDATSKANAAQAAAISAAATDATSKANAAQAAAISAAATDATSKANAAQAAAISAVTNGAGSAFDTLKEIQDAMATDSELSSAISAITTVQNANKLSTPRTISLSGDASGSTSFDGSGNVSISVAVSNNSHSHTTGNISGFTEAVQDIVGGMVSASGSAGVSYNDTAGTLTISATDTNTDTNTTYSAGNGLSLSGTTFSMSGSYSGSFTATGDITAYSDDSLKTNVQVIDGALGKVEAIRGVTFDRIEDGSTSTGVIAQELEAVLPEAVKQDENGVRHVAYGNITGLLIEAVKELSAQVAELKNAK